MNILHPFLHLHLVNVIVLLNYYNYIRGCPKCHELVCALFFKETKVVVHLSPLFKVKHIRSQVMCLLKLSQGFIKEESPMSDSYAGSLS